jgi:predicted component of type VI protein secretion system
MSEQAGPSPGAIQARQAAMARQHSTVADADRVLAEALASAHAVMRESVSRLDAIAAEIDRVVSGQAGPAIDTPMGAREFQKFLVAKQREIAAVVAHAHELDRAKSAVLQSLRAHYTPPAG